MRRKWGLGLIVLLLTLGFLMPAPMPALAASGDVIFCTSMGLFATLVTGGIAYGIWELSRPDQPRFLNGEFYAGGFMGAAFTPSQNLRYSDGFTLNGVPGGGSHPFRQ